MFKIYFGEIPVSLTFFSADVTDPLTKKGFFKDDREKKKSNLTIEGLFVCNLFSLKFLR